MYEQVLSPFYDIDGFSDILLENEEFWNCFERFKIENSLPSVNPTAHMMFMIGQATLMAHHMPREEDHRMVEPPSVDEIIADIENKPPLLTIPEEPNELTIVDSDDVDKTEPKPATPPPLTIGSEF